MTDSSEILSAAEKKRRRGAAQRLKPHVHIGRNGLTPTVIAAIDTAIVKQELIKVRFEGDRLQIRELCSAIVTQLRCQLVGSVGKTASFYRKRPDQS